MQTGGLSHASGAHAAVPIAVTVADPHCMTAHPVLRPPQTAMPVSRIVAAMVAMAVITGVFATYALFALRPELFTPSGPPTPVVPALPTASPDVASPSPSPSPTPSPTPVASPTATPLPSPT